MRRRILTLLIIFFSGFLFLYPQSIKIVSPHRGAILLKGNTYTIRWEKSGNMSSNVKIRLMQSGVKVLGITDSTPNNGSFSWAVPASLANGSYYIRVKTIDNVVYDDGEKFTITDAPLKKESITITSPKSGDIWNKGKTYLIKWTKSGTMNANVKIRLMQGGTKILGITDSTTNDGSFSWTVPSNLPNGSYYIRVKTIDNLVYDDSDMFNIAKPSSSYIKVLSPNGGEKIAAPGTLNIKWETSSDIKYVKIMGIYTPRGGGAPVKQYLAERDNTGSFSFKLTDKVYDSKQYKIRIEDYSDPSVYDESDGYFEIYHSEKPYLKIIHPSGGESFKIGDSVLIKWEAKGFDLEIRAELWKGNNRIGYIFKDLTMSQALDGRKLWQISNQLDGKTITPGDDYFIVLKAKNIRGLESKSGLFSIKPQERTEPKPYIEKIFPVNVRVGDEIEIFGKNFYSQDDHSVVCGDGKYSVTLKALEWKKNYIRITTKNTALKAGNRYALKIRKTRGEGAFSEKTDSNNVYFKVLEPEESFDISISSYKYEKDMFTKGEIADFIVTVTNKGPSTVKKYKIIVWSVRGGSNSVIRGNTGLSFQRKREIKANESITEEFKLKIKDSPGDYTLFIKFESVEPASNKDKDKSDNVLILGYRVSYKLPSINKQIVLQKILPDLTFDSKRTKIGVNGVKAVIKNPNYKKAKLPTPKIKKIYVRVEEIDPWSHRVTEFFLPESIIKELNKAGETDYISRWGIKFHKARITIDSKNSISESNENNNTIFIEK